MRSATGFWVFLASSVALSSSAAPAGSHPPSISTASSGTSADSRHNRVPPTVRSARGNRTILHPIRRAASGWVSVSTVACLFPDEATRARGEAAVALVGADHDGGRAAAAARDTHRARGPPRARDPDGVLGPLDPVHERALQHRLDDFA